ncbi:MAG: hypothetical protein COA96_14115 [SAR86 cluster bacterium]|uniref:DNA-binding protein n=1 Tax=SAR86 cluster bacterium TaxID=2030880 RepID=A0A2A5ATQ7_9GAMM|nr:MAG: hypothetical protein COA96_14115 [SAR86 cluster bacterium]
MTSIIQIDTPMVTVKEFSKRSGIPVRTVQTLIHDGEIPRFDQRLNKDKRGPLYINFIRLVELCQQQGKDFIDLNLS